LFWQTIRFLWKADYNKNEQKQLENRCMYEKQNTVRFWRHVPKIVRSKYVIEQAIFIYTFGGFNLHLGVVGVAS
jgi:hypothetical protein